MSDLEEVLIDDDLTGADDQEEEQYMNRISISMEIESQELADTEITMIQSEEPVPVYKYGGLNSCTEVMVLLQQIRPGHAGITRVPPQKPLAHGQVYVYALTDGQSPYDWRFDGFQWANLRGVNFPRRSANQVLSRHEFRLIDNGTQRDFFRHEYHEYGQNFRAPIDLRYWNYPYIIIHYFGDYPVNQAVIAPHGNRKTRSMAQSQMPQKRRKKAMPPNRSMTEATDSAVVSVAGDGITIHLDDEGDLNASTGSSAKRPRISTNYPNGVYETVEIEGTESDKPLSMSQFTQLSANGIEVSGPNFRKRAAVNQKKSKATVFTPHAFLSKEDIQGCYLFKESLGDNKVIRRLDFPHGTNVIIAENHLVAHANTLLGSGVVGDKITFAYQATAKLYHFLVSTLFMKHPLFEGEPCIPLATLLHREHNDEMHGRFFRTMKELIPSLDSHKINLIVCNETGVMEAIENELPNGMLQVSIPDPEGPRISNLKLDFVLVSIARGLSFDYTKMVHVTYFLQCYHFNEIRRCLLGNCGGDLLIESKYESITWAEPTLAERVLPKGVWEDLEDSLPISKLIQMLSRTPPTVLGSGNDYEQCSKNELQLFEGLAHFFISKDRIEWVKSKFEFQVKGLGGKFYNVKLSDRTCTCLRGKACEHVLAVLMATGLLVRQTQ